MPFGHELGSGTRNTLWWNVNGLTRVGPPRDCLKPATPPRQRCDSFHFPEEKTEPHPCRVTDPRSHSIKTGFYMPLKSELMATTFPRIRWDQMCWGDMTADSTHSRRLWTYKFSNFHKEYCLEFLHNGSSQIIKAKKLQSMKRNKNIKST